MAAPTLAIVAVAMQEAAEHAEDTGAGVSGVSGVRGVGWDSTHVDRHRHCRMLGVQEAQARRVRLVARGGG